jgi:hypothetical protein
MHDAFIGLVDTRSELELLLLGETLIVEGLFGVDKFLGVDLPGVDLEEVLVRDHLVEEVSHTVFGNSGFGSVSLLFFISCC